MKHATVLIVDDTQSCGDNLAVALTAIPNLEVCIVEGAHAALHMMETRPIAALITDLHMPQIDGFELIQRVRAQDRFAMTPILVISGDTDPATPERVKRLGANVFMAKPYSPSIVRQTLEQLLYET